MSKVVRDCLGCAFLRSVIGPENSRHSVNQSHSKLKPTMTCSLTFVRALGSLFSWLWVLINSVKRIFLLLIGRYDYLGFDIFETQVKTALSPTHGKISAWIKAVPELRFPYHVEEVNVSKSKQLMKKIIIKTTFNPADPDIPVGPCHEIKFNNVIRTWHPEYHQNKLPMYLTYFKTFVPSFTDPTTWPISTLGRRKKNFCSKLNLIRELPCLFDERRS